LLLSFIFTACIPSQPSPTAFEPPPTLPPTWTPEPSVTPSLDVCQITTLAPVTAYQRPSLEAVRFADFAAGEQQTIAARTDDGWLGFDPGIAQAANVGPFRLRWVQESEDVQLEGACTELPVMQGPAPGVCFTMAMGQIPLYLAPTSATIQLGELQTEEYAKVVRRAIDGWLLVDAGAGSAVYGDFGWMDGRHANFNGPCTDLMREPFTDYPIRRFGAEWEFQITHIHMITTEQGWALARGETSEDHILRTEDGGLTWRDVSPPEPRLVGSDLRKTALGSFLDADLAQVVYLDRGGPDTGPYLSFWTSQDGGQTWQARGRTGPLFTGEPPQHLTFVNPQNGWLLQNTFIGMGHHAFLLFRTQDGGASYDRLHAPPSSESMCRKMGLAFADPQHGWMTNECPFQTGEALLDVTQDGGGEWQQVSLPPPTQEPDFFTQSAYCYTHSPVLFTPAQGKLVVSCIREDDGGRSTERYLYSTTDGGGTWLTDPLPASPSATPDEGVMQEILFLDPLDGWLLGREIYLTEDGGETWTRINLVTWDAKFSFVDEQNGWAAARAGDEWALVRTQDGGRTWQQLEPVIEARPAGEACTLRADGPVAAYNRPSLEAQVFAEMPGDMELYVTAQTADGWVGFDPAYAQAGNIGVFHHRWVPPNSAVTLSGDCDDLPLVTGPAPNVCFTMVGFPVPVYSAPDSGSLVIATLDYGEYTQLLGESADGAWMQVNLAVGTVGLDTKGWIDRSAVQFNGPCGDLPTVNP
jgi:hypothetical protein